MEQKRLYRSTSDRIIGGVAAGLAEYFKLDPLLVRLLFVVFTIIGGGGIIIYLILWIATPDKPFIDHISQNSKNMENHTNQEEHPYTSGNPAGQEKNKEKNVEQRQRGNLIGGLVLITIGAIFLLDQFIPRVDFGDLWPIILIAIGIGLLFNNMGKYKKTND